MYTMSNTDVLQVRLPATINVKAKKRAKNLGFTSLQEVVRIFLNSFVRGRVEPGIVNTKKTISLSSKARERWDAILNDIDKEKNIKSFDNPEDLLLYLQK